MKRLRDILSEITVLQSAGSLDVAVTGLAIDTRQLAEGYVFVARKGATQDGHDFIPTAPSLGATTIVCEVWPNEIIDGITYVQVSDAAQAAGLMTSAFYNHPSRAMKVVGVTGTNGKTTVATLLYQLFTKLGFDCGLLSTVQHFIAGAPYHSTHTTPDAIGAQALMARMRDKGCQYVFMEVSSHAVHQQRIAGIHFAGGLFTNITHDHLDYHNTFDEYIRVKKRFFDGLPAGSFALSNKDDKRGAVMLQNTAASRQFYSLRAPAEFSGKVLENGLTGLIMNIAEVEIHFRMIGTFNAYNLLAVFGAATLLGIDRDEALAVLSDLQGAPGRFQTVHVPAMRVLGIVDYAHTPDALINVLATINQLRTGGQKLITVIGCGGDRDKTKRPLMAQVACEHSDRAVLTADNPRTENPEAILDDMELDLSPVHRRKMLRITDRRQAIRTACALAAPQDIILVAGKGHENYQEINGQRQPFDDVHELLQALQTTEN